MKHWLTTLALLLLLMPGPAPAQIWQLDPSVQSRGSADGAVFAADDAALRATLDSAGPAGSPGPMSQIELPLPDGSVRAFRLVEAPVMAPVLAARYPQIRSYRVFGPDSETASGRIDISPRGFHGMVATAAGTVVIDPRAPGAADSVYRSRYRERMSRPAFSCGVHDAHTDLRTWLGPRLGSANRVAGSLLRYRIAIAVTNEYYVDPALGNGNDIATTAAINTTLNRVNLVYERDLGITLQLVASNDEIYEKTDTGLLDNEDERVLLGQIDNWIDSRLTGGDSAYDIGHVFSKPSGPAGAGIAFLGAVCDNAIKAGGVSGSPNPMGDAFDIDLVAHEIGHQFDAAHTFNGTTSSCLGNRVAATAFEPGSGSTIMAYAGICGAENLQTNSDDTFHAGSIAQIDSFTGAGGSCYALDPIVNTEPSIAAIADTSIPANTPFVLDGSAADPDPDTLSYQWDQIDAGCATDASGFGTDNGSNALFRSYAPRPESRRNFPALGTQIQGQFDKAEVLACHSRALDFRLTVRDGASGQDTEDVRLTVVDTAGPFAITDPNSTVTITDGGPVLVTWNVANTNQAPISCATVDIDLLAFSPGSTTYSIHSILASTANDGSESVTIVPTTSENPRARIRVKCSNNVFYDISDANLNIVSTNPAAIPFDDNDFVTRFNLAGTVSGVAPVCGPIVDCAPPAPINAASGPRDATAFDARMLAILLVLFGVRLYRRQGLH